MIVISNPEKWPYEYYPEVESPQGDILSKYAITAEYDGGYILFHTITWSLYFLSKDEMENVLDNRTLREYRIVLDASINEDEIAKKVYLERTESPKEMYRTGNMNSFVIFTTTSCNARCAYCYEKGIKHVGMTLATADKVADYILSRSDRNKRIRLRWFGGEPLLNVKVIDRIVDKLLSEGVVIVSDMITNGLLLNSEVVEKLPKWSCNKIQVTIDGIGEDYNKIKNYKNPSVDPFTTVISNIHEAAKIAKISVRVNVSGENVDQLLNILSFLHKEFETEVSEKQVKIYISPIYQIREDEDGGAPEGYFEKIEEAIKAYPESSGTDMILRKQKMNHCGADRGTFESIDSRGNIGTCEHWKDENIIGNIGSGITNWEVAEKWRVKDGENIAFCTANHCPILPVCDHFLMCEANSGCHTIPKMEHSLEYYKKCMKATYNFYKEKVGK